MLELSLTGGAVSDRQVLQPPSGELVEGGCTHFGLAHAAAWVVAVADVGWQGALRWLTLEAA